MKAIPLSLHCIHALKTPIIGRIITTFFEVLKKLMAKFKHTSVVNFALGHEKGTITMVMPESNGMIRTGLPHIAESEEEKKQHKTHEVEIVKGSELLNDIERIDYIKCDIEGYEVYFSVETPPIDLVRELSAPITSIKVSVTSDTVYYWKVIVIDEEGNKSDTGIYTFKVL